MNTILQTALQGAAFIGGATSVVIMVTWALAVYTKKTDKKETKRELSELIEIHREKNAHLDRIASALEESNRR